MKTSSIRTRILRYLLFLSLVPLLIISAVSYYTSYSIVASLAIDAVENQVAQVNTQMDGITASIERLGWMIADDSVIQANLREPLPADIEERYSQAMDVNFTLLFIKEYQEDVHSFFVIGENGALFKSDLVSELDVHFQSTGWYQSVLNSDTPVWFEPHEGSFVINSIGQPMLSVGVPIVDKLSGKNLGAVILDIEAQRFLDLFDTELLRDGRLVLVNGHNELLVYPEMDVSTGTVSAQRAEEIEGTVSLLDDLLSTVDASEPYTGKLRTSTGEEYLLMSSFTAVSGWRLVGIVPYASILRDSFRLAVVISVAFAVVVLAVALLANKISTSIVKPLKTVSDSMQRVMHGDFTNRVHIDTDDEVGTLSKSYNSMLDEINTLMDKEREDQAKLRKSEQRALQAQINPHFLYNTLDSINWLARAGEMDKVCETVEALTNFFRLGLSRGKDYITLEEELRHVENYLHIQKIRYASKLEYIIDVPGNLGQYSIAKLVLQPLVENSIYHGIKYKQGMGFIEIGGKEEGEDILLWVSDTGLGMPAERLAALNSAITSDENTTSIDSYGIVNVQKRIQIYYGPQYGLHYESVYNEGTTAYLRIPKKREG